MKFYTLSLILPLFVFACTNEQQQTILTEENTEFRNGDIIFQTSTSSQSEAIQLATDSKYSHVGIMFEQEGQWFILEAIQPVSITLLNNWIKRGENGTYRVKRLKDASILSNTTLLKMNDYGESLLGKNYDSYFEWSDDKIYCSELVWKIYKEGAGIELCPLSTYQDFDLSHPTVQAKIKERFGAKLPVHELVVSPDDIYNSELLKDVE